MSDNEDEEVLYNTDDDDNLNQNDSDAEEEDNPTFQECFLRKLNEEGMDMKPFVDSIFDFFMNNDIGQTSKSV
jgi:hypothetical protein